MLGDRKWPVWLHRACEEKIGDKGGKALALTPWSPKVLAQSGLFPEEPLLPSYA